MNDYYSSLSMANTPQTSSDRSQRRRLLSRPDETKVISDATDEEVYTWASFYKVDHVLKDLFPGSFNPKYVSVGPHNFGETALFAFKGRKKSYLDDLLNRVDAPKEDVLVSIMRCVYASMNNIRGCYGWRSPYEDSQLAEIIVMDACFILEFMLKISESEEKPFAPGRLLHVQSILHDLILLENQIPFFILDEIFQRTVLKFRPDTTIAEILLPVLSSHNVFEADLDIKSVTVDTHHILGLLHECYKPPANHISVKSFGSTVKPASVLKKVGVNIKPNEHTKWVMGMDTKLPFFGSWSKPVLRMPVLVVDDHTELVLKNLIAYEQSYAPEHRYVTSYANALGILGETKEDIDVMIKSGVLFNSLGSNEQVVGILKSVSIYQTASVSSIYDEQWKKLDKYCIDYLSRMKSSNPSTTSFSINPLAIRCSSRIGMILFKFRLVILALVGGVAISGLYWKHYVKH